MDLDKSDECTIFGQTDLLKKSVDENLGSLVEIRRRMCLRKLGDVRIIFVSDCCVLVMLQKRAMMIYDNCGNSISFVETN